MLPVGISFEFSWMRTFCQSENLLCSIESFHPVRFEHVKLGQTVGCGRNHDDHQLPPFPVAPAVPSHLCVLELLFDVPHNTLALVANKCPVDQLGANLARPRHRPRDARELANLVGAHVADAFDQREVVEREGEGSNG